MRSKKAARRAGNNIYQFLKDRLRLPINREKSGIRRPLTFELLGYGFVSSYKKGERGKYQLVVSKSKWEKLKAELKAITRKTIPMTFDERIQRLNWLIRGWLNYFKHASIHGKLKTLDGWIRNRLRYCIWHHWMTDRSRRVNERSLRVKVQWTFKRENREAGGLANQWTFKREKREAGGLAIRWTFKGRNRVAGGLAILGTFKGGNREADGRQRKRKNLIRLGVDHDHAYAWTD